MNTLHQKLLTAECSGKRTGTMTDDRGDANKAVSIRYKNHRGEIAVRVIIPHEIRFASTSWHPESQWLLDAYDLDRQAIRSFALKDIMEWAVKHNTL